MDEVKDFSKFGSYWLHAKSQHSIRLVYVSKMSRAPLLFALLSAKFRNRYMFSKYTLKGNSDVADFRKLLNLDFELPKTFVCLISDRKVYFYANDTGTSRGNFLHFNNLFLFLQIFSPDVNLLFTGSIYLCNFLASLSFFMSSGRIFSRCMNTLKSFFMYNAVLIFSWLLLSSSKPKPFLQLLDLGLEYLHSFSTTKTASDLRQCFLFFFSKRYLVCSGFLLFFFSVVITLRKLNIIQLYDDTDSLADMLLLNENRSNGYNDISRRWVERLATPALWLQPLVSNEYIENLPVWKYTGECFQNSGDSDSSAGTRTSSVSPDRKWTSHQWRKERRGRSCFFSRESTSKRLKKGFLWGLKSCFRGRSPRFNRLAGPPKEMKVEPSCSVCLENYRSQSSLCGLPCGHVFHHECILQWLHSDKHCCPVCRWPAYQAK